MPIRLREYYRSPNPTSAGALLQRTEVHSIPIACGPRVPIQPYTDADSVVDLSLLQLDSIATNGGFVGIGGQTTLQALIDAPPLQSLAGGILPRAAQLAAHLGLRHLATVGGLLLGVNNPPEVRLALLALEANIVTQGVARQMTPLINYQSKQNDLVLEITFQQLPAECGGALARVARTPLDQAIVVAVAVVGPHFARVAIAGASPHPIVKSVTGFPVNTRELAQTVVAEVDPIGDYRGSAEYRRAMAGVLARRALDAAFGRG